MKDVSIRLFNAESDMAQVQRVWHEVGWVDTDKDDHVCEFFAVGRALVAQLNGEVECAVHTVPGTMRYETVDLPLCVVSAVTTSRVARRMGLAQRLTARQLAHGAEQGAAMSALGMFDQGFYDRLGFAPGPYDNSLQFDPSTLAVNVPYRNPVRLGRDDYAAMHTAMSKRLLSHGGCVLEPPMNFKAELGWYENGFGLGYRGDADAPADEVTHFLYFEPKGEHGPYSVQFIAYRSLDQLLELLGLLKSLGDQVYSVWMVEPPEIQLQALLQQPFRHRVMTRDGKHMNHHRANAWCEYRILDVARCVQCVRWDGEPIEFDVELSDPVGAVLQRDGASTEWTGCAGSYRVRLAQQSDAQPIGKTARPNMKASINAFTRLLWGISPASGLLITDDFAADAQLIPQLDRALRLPPPRTGWDF